MTCQICCEEYNKSTRKEVTCNHCNETFCSACVKKYVIEEACMCLSCKGEWNNDFLSSVLTKKFMSTEYRDMKKKKLFDKELALLPTAMHLAEMTLKKEKLLNDVQLIDKSIRNLYNQRQLFTDEIDYYQKALNEPQKAIKYKGETVGCCSKEGCRGFIFRKNWTCGVCNTEVCKHCFEVLTKEEGEGKEHVCKEENIETVKLIMKECKPCPKCSAQIFKIEGCDQMYCVQCNTAFSWLTGKIETGRIHNPHYYEWVRQNNNGVVPRERDDGPCLNRLVDYYNLIQLLQSMTPRNLNFERRVMGIHRQHVHYSEVEVTALSSEKDNTALRINYLLNRLSKEDYEKEIEKRHRLSEKNRAILNILELYLSVMVELFNNFISEVRDKRGTTNTQYENFFVEYERIRSFTNDNLQKLSEKCNFGVKRFLLQIIE